MLKQKSILILLFFVCASCDFTPAGEYYNKALALEKQGKLEEAIAYLDSAIDKEPQFRPALLNRGYYKSELGDYQGGITDYKKLLAFDRDNTAALYNIGNNFGNLKKHNKSIAYYNEALKTKGALKNHPSPNGYSLIIETNFDFKDFDSDTDYNILDSKIYFDRGIEFLEIEMFDKAICDINRSLKANNEVIGSYFLLGRAYIGKKDSIQACQNFIEAAKLGSIDAREMLKKHCIKKKRK